MDTRGSIPRSVALDRLRERRPFEADGPTVRMELAEVAGRTTAEPVTAPIDVPQHDRATMDGFAFAASDEYPLRVTDAVFPEDEPPTIDRGDAVAVATGAALPARADVVLMREEATVEDGSLSGPPQTPGTNVYPAGATATAGERLFTADHRLAPRHAALLRDVGIDSVLVYRPLTVGILPTGTEIHHGRQPDRDSEMLCNLVRRWGHRPGIEDAVPDAIDRVRTAIETAAAEYDVVLTTGGTSVGGADHVITVLEEHDVLFRGVDVRPGRPVTVGTVAETPVCALPGKPVAAHTAATLLVRPFLTGCDRLPTVTADCRVRVTVPDADVEFAIPVVLEGRGAMPLGHASSELELYDERFAPGRVASSTRVLCADGIVLTREAIEAGDPVTVVPYEVLE
nr:molybdopterin molybdotransferase MoeA [Halalkalicoccus jeotgali]